MRFSLFYDFDVTPEKDIAELYRDVEAQAILADRLGFDAIWLAEHHFTVYGRLPSPVQYLTWIAARTQQLDLGTAVIEAPYYHPLRLAEDTALLDVLSNGRVRLGVGSGAKNKTEEFATFNIGLDEKTSRTLETTEILRQAFDGGVVDFAGEHFQYENVHINPRPVQPASDIIWMAASESTPELAGKHGFRLQIPRVGTAARHRELIQRYRAALDG